MTSTNQRKFKGVVVSDKMDKTITVRVDRVRTHKKYGKRYTVSNRYKVHDEKNQYKENDIVEFIEYRRELKVLRASKETKNPIAAQDAQVSN